jgi:hypothetical protein
MGTATTVDSARPVRSLRRVALVIAVAMLSLSVSGTGPHWARSAAAIWAGTGPSPERLALSAQPLPDTAALVDIACPTSDRCYALGVGDDGPTTVSIDDGVAGPAQPLEYLFLTERIVCPATDSCFAVGRGGTRPDVVGVVVGLVPGQPAVGQTVAGTFSLNGIACPSRTECYAVGVTSNGGIADGIVVPVTGTTPGDVQQVAGAAELDDIACPSPQTCYAVGSTSTPNSEGVVVTLDGGSAGAAQTVAQASTLSGVACATPEFCYAVGSYRATGSDGNVNSSAIAVPIVDGAPGAALTLASDSVSAYGIACTPDSACIATGQSEGPDVGWVVAIDNGRVSPAQPASGAAFLGGIACPAIGRCYTVGKTEISIAISRGVLVAVSLPAAGPKP